jgi:nitroreductase
MQTGMRLPHAATYGLLPTARFRPPIWARSSRPAAGSPSSQNWQPWDFILVTDREQLRELAKVWRGASHVAGSAATIVVIGPAADNEFHRAQLDLGQATMAMLLAATDLGIGSCHAGVADVPLARRLLGFPEDRTWALLISLGYPADRPLVTVSNPRRRPFGEVVHHDRW